MELLGGGLGEELLGGGEFGAADESGEPPRKAPRREPGGREGDWICVACGNQNYKDRPVCNMRKCGAPRPGQDPGPGLRGTDWTCPACGNMNFADRMVCNMRSCRAPRPGAAPQAGGIVGGPMPFKGGGRGPPFGGCGGGGYGGGGYGGGGGGCGFGGAVMCGAPPVAMMQAAAMQPAGGFGGGFGGSCGGGGKGGKAPRKQGDWQCQSCGNMNFADRAFCNMRKCEAPRVIGDWQCQACGNKNFFDRAVCNMRKCQAPRTDVDPKVALELASKGYGKGKGVKGKR